MRWVLKFIKEYSFRYWFANFLIILGGGITKILPVILLGKIIDKGIYENNFSIIPFLFLISISMFFVGRVITYFGILIIDHVRFNLAHKLKVECYKKLNELDQTFYEKKSLGEISTLFTTDNYIIHHNVCYVIKQSMSMLVTSVLSTIYCIYINPILTLIVLIPTPIIAFISKKHIKRTNKLYKDRRESLSNLNNYIQENIEGNRLVKMFATEEKEINDFKVKNNNLKDKSLNIQNMNISYDNKVSFLSYCMQILSILFGGLFVINGCITIGGFVIINSFISTIKRPYIELSKFVNEWQQFKVSISKVRKLLESETKIKDLGSLRLNNWNVISFEGVDVLLNNKKVLRDVNLNLKPNKTYAFIGEIGSGKSTIGKLILRLVECSNGEIKIDDNLINNYTLKSLRDNIGYVSQTPFLFSDTISNNVSFGNEDLKEEEIIKYLKLAKADFVFNLSEGINTIIGEKGASLSGGEKQRLSLARALSKKPSILILDDITSALDFETELEVVENINNLKYSCTKIIIAQKILSVKNADVIFVMSNGRIVESGLHEELLNKNGEYKEIYDIQVNNMEE